MPHPPPFPQFPPIAFELRIPAGFAPETLRMEKPVDNGDGTYSIPFTFVGDKPFDLEEIREQFATAVIGKLEKRPDDHAANYFDGGIRTAAEVIRTTKYTPGVKG